MNRAFSATRLLGPGNPGLTPWAGMKDAVGVLNVSEESCALCCVFPSLSLWRNVV